MNKPSTFMILVFVFFCGYYLSSFFSSLDEAKFEKRMERVITAQTKLNEDFEELSKAKRSKDHQDFMEALSAMQKDVDAIKKAVYPWDEIPEPEESDEEEAAASIAIEAD